MFRTRLTDRTAPVEGPGKDPARINNSDNSENYFYTHHAHVPLVTLARIFGLLPTCTRFPLMIHLQSRGNGSSRGRIRHLAAHALLWAYCFILWLTNTSLTILLTVYVCASAKDKSIKFDINWGIFDIVTCWQTTCFSTALIVCSGNFGWFMSSLDYLMVSFATEVFTRPEVEIIHPTESLEDRILGEIPEIEPPRREESQKTEEFEEPCEEFAEKYIRYMRSWVIAITLFAAGFFLTFVTCLVAYRLQDYATSVEMGNRTAADQKRASLPLREMVLWAAKMAEREYPPKNSDVIGLVAECLQVAVGTVSPALFASCAVSLTILAVAFNKRLRATEDRFLDIDKTLIFHLRFKRLLRRLEKSFAAVIFFTIIGDLVVIITGTFLGFRHNCIWKQQTTDGVCQGYLIRHSLILIQLLTVSIFGAALNDKMVDVSSVLDVYLNRRIQNTERLKILGLMHETPSCAFSAWGFFKLSRPGILALFTVVVVYVSVVLRQHF